jgi:hypothetical protein
MPKSAKKEPKATQEEGYIVCDEPESIARSDTVKSKELASSDVDRPVIGRAATTSSFWPTRKNSKDITGVDNTAQRPIPRKAKSEGTVVLSGQTSKPLPSLPNSGDGTDFQRFNYTCTEFFRSVTNVPTWLLNAATALDFLKGEHPRVMSTLSAILIVAGTIPSLPVVSAGAAGAVLASSTAHAVGAIAIGLGSWIKTQQEGKSQQETHSTK